MSARFRIETLPADRVTTLVQAPSRLRIAVVASTAGEAPWCGALGTNVGHVGINGLVDRGLPASGILAEGGMNAGDWVFAELDPAWLEAVRRDRAARNHLNWPAAPPPAPVARFA